MKYNFKNHKIIVTGATRGIGKQIADDLSNLGANLILTGTDKDKIKDLNALNSNPDIEFVYLDFLDSKSVELFIKFIFSLNKVDVLINNAGINKLNSIQDAKDQDWEEMMNVNLSGPFKLIRAVSEKMIQNSYGRILNIASIFSIISKAKRVIYTSTKFGLHGLTVGTSNDLARYNILCNSLSPGFVMTDLTRKNLSEDEISKLKNEIPIRRFADVSDISKSAIYLVSNLNQYITGQNIAADGGFTNV
jgi:3-oxoacyl-[acyl-carrier protein] reductase